MIFAVDIGNSNIHTGIFRDGICVHSFRMGTSASRTSDEYAFLLKSLTESAGFDTKNFSDIIIGSVAPSVTGIIQKALNDISDVPVMTVGPGIKTGFPIKLNDPSELGADLVANAAGAVKRCSLPLIIADFGTATAISAMDKNGAYLGGCIMPGIQMSLDALHSAELLPGVSAESETPLIGRNTRESMLSGVIRGNAMAVIGFTENCKRTYFENHEANVVVTGGFAPKILKYLPKEADYMPNLTLEGLYEIYKLNVKKKR